MTPPAHRVVEVPGDRLHRWVAGFSGRHGGYDPAVQPGQVTLTAPDGATAVLESPWGATLQPSGPAGPDAWIDALADAAAQGRDAAVLLVRRGGYAVGLLAGGTLTRHKVGTRYVQSRTAAGGWSQQRFARRRDGQAKALTGAARDAFAALLARTAPVALVVGGDRLLVAEVLEDPRLGRAAAAPRRELWDVADPRLRTLSEVAERARSVRVRLNDLA